MEQDYKKEIETLKKDLKDLTEEMYRNNFSASQDFNKKVSFTTAVKVPHYTTLPSVGEVGEILEMGGALYICSTPNNFSLV